MAVYTDRRFACHIHRRIRICYLTCLRIQGPSFPATMPTSYYVHGIELEESNKHGSSVSLQRAAQRDCIHTLYYISLIAILLSYKNNQK